MSDGFSGTIAGLVSRRSTDDAIGLRLHDQSWTWRQIVAEAATRAAWLRATLDPDRPPHVGVLLPNSPEFVFTLFGAALAGATVVGLNPTRGAGELPRDVIHTECQLVLTDADYADLVDEPMRIESAPWQQFAGAALPVNPDPATQLLLIFTSGSTSAPKAVRRSQGRLAAGANLGFRETDVLYCAMPLFHGNALSSTCFPALAAGATLALRERFSASHWLDDVRAYGATFANTVGRALGYILATEPTEHDRDHHLAVVLSPEASPRDAEAFGTRFGVRVLSGYGQSEGGIVLLPSAKKTSMGRPPRGTDLAVVDAETMTECPPAEFDGGGRLVNGESAIGELVRRDANGFEGYWNNPEADAARTRNGWYWSGDLAYRDVDGDFFFAGRVGEWLRVDSENFAAAPVERVVERFDGFAAVAVVGVPDPQSGDQVLAAVELVADMTFDPVAFGQFLDDQRDLGTKWAPRFIRISSSLPVGGNDKIDRRSIRRAAWLTDGTRDVIWWRRPRSRSFEPFTATDRAELRAEFSAHGRADAHPG